MKKVQQILAALVVIPLFIIATILTIPASNAMQSNIDVNYLQTCLKEEGSSLDVLVLMDSSKSLRDGKIKGSDPEKLRGPILKSSLKILRSLAENSQRDFKVSLRNFGANEDPTELKKLQDRWINWTNKTSDEDLSKFVTNAVYDDSPGTYWSLGLASARSAFNERLGQATLDGKKSCPIMFWITDGGPDPSPDQQKSTICSSENAASIDWFRQNNVLVLGGLLKPKGGRDRDQAGYFRPIVEGSNCGRNEQGWTRGSVVEADDVSSLAWQFVGLIAKVKNLIDLGAMNSSFTVDQGTSQIDIYIRGNFPDWQIKTPDGTTICSASQQSSRCKTNTDSEVGITSITIYPSDPTKTSGIWTVTPAIDENRVAVFGGIDTTPPALSAKLIITPGQTGDLDEGKPADFKATLVNADESPFKLDDYQSINICAELRSTRNPVCSTGGISANLQITPNTTDKSVVFQAFLVPKKFPDRKYQVSASATLNVVASKNFPSLVCAVGKANPCKLTNLKNKNKPSETVLQVLAAEVGNGTGKIYPVSYSILQDRVPTRGDGHFKFQIQKASGEIVPWNNNNTLLEPGDKLKLLVSTKEGGKSEIKGVIKYVVVSEDKVIPRQLKFSFNVSEDKNWLALFALLFITYLISLGIPYAFLLISARRNAVLLAPENEFSTTTIPIKLTNKGKIVGFTGETLNTTLQAPSHRELIRQEIENRAKSVEIGSAHIEVIPPKWNPFVNARTRVFIKGHHLVTTVDSAKFKSESAGFSQQLVNEAVVFVKTDDYFQPLSKETSLTEAKPNNSQVFESSFESKIIEELIKNERELIGQALLVVPYLSNKRKSLDELISKLISSIEGADLLASLEDWREKYLKEAQAKRQKPALSENERFDSRKSSKSTLKNAQKEQSSSTENSIFDEPKKNNSLWESNDDFPGSESGRKLWD